MKNWCMKSLDSLKLIALIVKNRNIFPQNNKESVNLNQNEQLFTINYH
jgi:hypothetical protein